VQMIRPGGAIVLPIRDENRTLYFFMDTGFPLSFSRDLDRLAERHLPECPGFTGLALPPVPAGIDIAGLEAHLGVRLSGFLGCDFFLAHQAVTLDFVARTVRFGQRPATGLALPLVGPPAPPMIRLGANAEERLPCLVDTGAWQCLLLTPPAGARLRSRGWVFPTAFDQLRFDFFADVPLFLSDAEVRCTVGVPAAPLPMPAPFSVVLGLNLLSRYTVCFDFERRLLVLGEADAPGDARTNGPAPLSLTSGLHSVGFQVVRKGQEILVETILPGCPNAGLVSVGDRIEIDGVDMHDPEMMNAVHASLTSDGPGTVAVGVNGQPVALSLSPVFG